VGFADLRSRYSTSEPVIVNDLPPGTASVVCRTAFGETHLAGFEGVSAVFPGLPAGTHVLEAWSRDGELLAEEYTTVSRLPGDDPVMAFATSFGPGQVGRVLSWLRSLRCTVVQFYDWMQQYSKPLPEKEVYSDPLGRQLSRSSLKHLVSGVRELGAVAQAYAPICAAEPAFAEAHQDWLLFGNDGMAQHLGNLLQIMDPANTAWQEHWIDSYRAAADSVGFDGFHLDTYGYPRRPFDYIGNPVPIRHAYGAFIERVRDAVPLATLSFNQVNGVPFGLEVPRTPSFRYAEVWPPNDGWRHLEGLIARSAAREPWAGGALALYPPVWGGDRKDAVRTVTLTEAVTTSLGAGLLVLGDDSGVLRDPYYPSYEQLTGSEASKVLDWHRFALRCRDLFRHGEDTSWCDVDDPNGAVRIEAPGAAVSPEPEAGTLFVRVVRTGPTIAISCIDLRGSTNGSWGAPTATGDLREAIIRVLVAKPARCRAEAAVLGASGGRFQEVELAPACHLEGNAAELRLPIVEGWSVARFDESY
jgi:dextranase